MTYKKSTLVISFLLFVLNIIPQGEYIHGGGTLMDWANLKKYKKKNEALIKKPITNRIVFIGNSVIEGWGLLSPSFFKTNVFVNRGIGGQTTPQMLIRFKPDVVNLNPKAVVIMGGINDIARNTGRITIANTAENIISMAELAIANAVIVYICSTLPAIDFPWSPGLNPSEKVVKLNTILKTYCHKNNATYIDFYNTMSDSVGGLKVPKYTSSEDLVHPNLAGYKVMENIVLEVLNKN